MKFVRTKKSDLKQCTLISPPSGLEVPIVRKGFGGLSVVVPTLLPAPRLYKETSSTQVSTFVYNFSGCFAMAPSDVDMTTDP